MDILISSNLERLLYLLGGPEITRDCMEKLVSDGKYTAPASVMEKIHTVMEGFYCTEAETARVIRDTFQNRGYLADPHTSVGIGCVEQYIAASGDRTKTVLASTASPYKFAADVCASLGTAPSSNEPRDILETLSNISGTQIPAPLAATLSLPIRFQTVVDAENMADFIFNK